VNTAPIVQDGSLTTSEDTTTTGQLRATDVDANTTLTYTVTSNPVNGEVILNSDGSYSYTPNADYNGSDSFKFKANDGTADSNEATVTITVIASTVLNLKNENENGNPYSYDTLKLFFDDDITLPNDLNQIAIKDANINVVPITKASVIDFRILSLYCPSMKNGQYTISIPTGLISNIAGTKYNGVIKSAFIVDLQELKTTLSNEIADAQNFASTTQEGQGLGQCSDQLAIPKLNTVITNVQAQNIINKTDATIDEINVAINTLQKAVEQVKNNIINTLEVTTPGAVSVNPNFDAIIEVKLGMGNFSGNLSSSNITLGGSFEGFPIKSVTVGSGLSRAQIGLSGNLSSVGNGTITINADGLENPVNSKDIMASIAVN